MISQTDMANTIMFLFDVLNEAALNWKFCNSETMN